MLLSHITSCTETVCLRKFCGRLVSIFLNPHLVSVHTVSMSVLRPGTVGVGSQWLCQGYTCHKLALKSLAVYHIVAVAATASSTRRQIHNTPLHLCKEIFHFGEI